jgi:hypothetical protein
VHTLRESQWSRHSSSQQPPTRQLTLHVHAHPPQYLPRVIALGSLDGSKSDLRTARKCDPIRAIARHQTNAVQVPASRILVEIVNKLLHINAVRYLAGALIAIHAGILLDVPVKVITRELSARASLFEAAFVVCRVALAANSLSGSDDRPASTTLVNKMECLRPSMCSTSAKCST